MSLVAGDAPEPVPGPVVVGLLAAAGEGFTLVSVPVTQVVTNWSIRWTDTCDEDSVVWHGRC